VQWAWSRPNKIGAVSLTSTLTSTLLNEFTFAFNSDGTGTIDLDPTCGALCDRGTYGLNFPFLFPGTKLADGKIPRSESRDCRRSTAARIGRVGRLRVRLVGQRDEGDRQPHTRNSAS